MTKYNFQVIPGFDVLQWKTDTQAEILRETEGMTNEEVREYLRKGAERFEKKIADIRYQRQMQYTTTAVSK